MNLYQVYFTYDEHEMENELFASESGTIADGRKYLLSIYGGEGEYMSNPNQLSVDGVTPFNTVHSSKGDPYKVVLA